MILGCTHYCLIKEEARCLSGVPVISPDEVVPEKLASYLDRHPEIETKLAKGGKRWFHVTDLTSAYSEFAKRLAGEGLNLEKVSL